jgi:hypothetical protein
MKQRLRFAVLVMLMLHLFSSCKNSNSPQAVTEKFLTSFVQNDFDKAKALSTKNTWEMLDIWASFTKDIPDAEKEKNAANFKVKILGVKAESDSTMIVTYSTDPKFLPFDKLRLLKQVDIDGRVKWKVDIATLANNNGDELYSNPADTASAVRIEMIGGSDDSTGVHDDTDQVPKQRQQHKK